MNGILPDLGNLSETRDIKEIPPSPGVFVVSRCSIKQAEKTEWGGNIVVAGKSDNVSASIEEFKLQSGDYFYWFSTSLPEDTQLTLLAYIQWQLSGGRSPGKI